MRTEGSKYVADVIANRLFAQVQHGGDLIRRCPFPEQLQYLVLTRRQAHHSGGNIARAAGQHDSEDA